jgi:hypothetical protein
MTAPNQNVGLSPSSPYIGGDALLIRIPCRDQTGSALNMAGATVTWQLFAFPAYKLQGSKPQLPALVTKTLGSGITIVSEFAHVKLNGSETADIEGMHYHKLHAVLASGDPYTLTTGLFLITPDLVP